MPDLERHKALLADPEGYRPCECPRCHHPVLHRHGYRERRPAPGQVLLVVRFLCPQRGCGAAWQVLPGFLPRHLQRGWAVVERHTLPEPTTAPAAPVAAPRQPAEQRAIPKPSTLPVGPASRRTVCRWKARLDCTARVLLQVLASVGTPALQALVVELPLDAPRGEFVLAYAQSQGVAPRWRLAALAEHVHRLAPGLRLM